MNNKAIVQLFGLIVGGTLILAYADFFWKFVGLVVWSLCLLSFDMAGLKANIAQEYGARMLTAMDKQIKEEQKND